MLIAECLASCSSAGLCRRFALRECLVGFACEPLLRGFECFLGPSVVLPTRFSFGHEERANNLDTSSQELVTLDALERRGPHVGGQAFDWISAHREESIKFRGEGSAFHGETITRRLGNQRVPVSSR